MEKITTAIQNEKWEEALEYFLEYTSENGLDATFCILGATIMEHFGEWDSMFDFIKRGLEQEIENHELYLLLGNYYSRENVNKAWLSYENALFYAKKSGILEDADMIGEMLSAFYKDNSVDVKNVFIGVIADIDDKYVEECKKCIEETCYEKSYRYEIINRGQYKSYTQTLEAVMMKAGEDEDIFFLSSDALLLPNSLFNLRMALYDDDKIGACSCISNYAYYNQVPVNDKVKTPTQASAFAIKNNIPNKMPYEKKIVLDTSFMLLRKESVKRMLPFDESIRSEGFSNIDFGMKMLQEGYYNCVCWNSYVFHYVVNEKNRKNLEFYDEDKKQIKKKWGFSPEYYMNTRFELANMIKPNKEQLEILEVGAGLGSTLSRIQYMYPNANVHGIELVESAAKVGALIVDMKCANIENYVFSENEKYDYIIFGDVLEHLVNPYSLLERLKGQLKEGGCIIASIPNILNAPVIYELLHGNFTYQDQGVLDRTHLRFFTGKEIVKMFNERGYVITEMIGSTYPTDSTEVHKEFWDKLLSIEGVVGREYFDVMQYIVCAQKND